METDERRFRRPPEDFRMRMEAVRECVLQLTRGIVNGEKQIHGVLETAMGTDWALAWRMEIESTPRSQIKRDTNIGFLGRDIGIGLFLLQNVFPQQFQTNATVDYYLNLQDEVGGQRRTVGDLAANPLRYYQDRAQILQAEKELQILKEIKYYYGEKYGSSFCHWWRVGEQESVKSVGIGGTGKIKYDSSGYEHIIHTRAFLETYLPKTYQFHFRHISTGENNMYQEALRLAEEKIHRAKKRRGTVDRFQQIVSLGNYLPEQVELMEFWIEAFSESTTLMSDQTYSRRAIARFNARHPDAPLKVADAEAVKRLFLGTATKHDTHVLFEYHRRRMLKTILDDQDLCQQAGQRVRKLIQGMIMRYNQNQDSNAEIAEDLQLPATVTGRLRRAFERLFGYSNLKRQQRDQAIAIHFDTYYPESVDFPGKVLQALRKYADLKTKKTAKQIVAELKMPISDEGLLTIISAVLDELPKRTEDI